MNEIKKEGRIEPTTGDEVIARLSKLPIPFRVMNPIYFAGLIKDPKIIEKIRKLSFDYLSEKRDFHRKFYARMANELSNDEIMEVWRNLDDDTKDDSFKNPGEPSNLEMMISQALVICREAAEMKDKILNKNSIDSPD